MQCSGIGIFTRKEPVIYLPVVRSGELQRIHGEVARAAEPLARGINEYYSAEIWIPHITFGRGRRGYSGFAGDCAAIWGAEFSMGIGGDEFSGDSGFGGCAGDCFSVRFFGMSYRTEKASLDSSIRALSIRRVFPMKAAIKIREELRMRRTGSSVWASTISA